MLSCQNLKYERLQYWRSTIQATDQGLPELGLDAAYERDSTTSNYSIGGLHHQGSLLRITSKHNHSCTKPLCICICQGGS